MSIQTLIVELNSIASNLANYFTSMADYLSTGTGTPPDFEDVAPLLVQDESLTSAQLNQLSNNGYGPGALNETLYNTASIVREASLLSQTKSDLYALEVSYFSQASSDVVAESARNINYIQGNSPEQSISL